MGLTISPQSPERASSRRAGKVRERRAKASGRPIDAKADMSHFALDILGTTALGRDFNAFGGEASKLYDAYMIFP